MYRFLITQPALACLVWLAVQGATPALADDPPFALSGEVTVTKVIDGDSLRSGRLKIRLHGIDAPERNQTCQTDSGEDWSCGDAATRAMGELIAAAPQLVCSLVDVDRYGRLVMRCEADGTDIAETLVARGLALAYRRYSTDYVAAADAAAQERRGMWQGRFDARWDWRRKN